MCQGLTRPVFFSIIFLFDTAEVAERQTRYVQGVVRFILVRVRISPSAPSVFVQEKADL